MTAAQKLASNLGFAEVEKTILVSSKFLEVAMYVSFIQFLFPVDMLLRVYFYRLTYRKGSIFDGLTILELALFICVFIWVYEYYTYGSYDPSNLFHLPTMGRG